MKGANSKGGLTSAQKYLVLFAVLLVPFSVGCKLNKDINCDNPKASCFKKDTTAPRVDSTTPASQPSVASPTPVATLNTLIINFTEPMKNADVKSNYPNPFGGGSSLNIDSVTKLNDKSYQLNLSGGVGNGSVQFDLSLLTDLAGNMVSPGQITVLTSAIAAVPDSVTSSGGYTETNITWTNTTPYQMTYAVKRNGTNCNTASAVTGTNVTGTVNSNQQVITNLGFAQITAGATDTIRVCLTPVSSGSDTEFTVSVSRDDTVPVTNDLTITNSRCAIPYSITLTCTDNVDRIIYTIDGSTPSFTRTTSGGTAVTLGATVDNPTTTFVYSIANGYTLNVHGNTTFRYLCVDKAGHLNSGGTAGVKSATCQSKLVWGDSNWSAASPPQPYDVWD